MSILQIISIIPLAMGLFYDALSLVWGIKWRIRGRGPSGLPVVQLIMYFVFIQLCQLPWPLRFVLFGLLTGMHIFCFYLGPHLYGDFLNGRTPAHRAVYMNRIERLKRLLQSGADPNATDNAGWTPLHIAVDTDREEAVRVLLDNGALLDIANRNSLTPLQMAEKSHPQIAEVLCSHIS